jgi:hypothetical protein
VCQVLFRIHTCSGIRQPLTVRELPVRVHRLQHIEKLESSHKIWAQVRTNESCHYAADCGGNAEQMRDGRRVEQFVLSGMVCGRRMNWGKKLAYGNFPLGDYNGGILATDGYGSVARAGDGFEGVFCNDPLDGYWGKQTPTDRLGIAAPRGRTQ